MKRYLLLVALGCVFGFPQIQAAEKKPAKPEPAAKPQVKLEGLHNCCGGCRGGITKAVESAGATCEIGEAKGTIYPTKHSEVTVMGASDDVLKKAILALAEAGYHGKSSRENLQMPDDSGFKLDGEDRVQGLTVHVPHNCCRKCSQAMVTAIKKVSGAQMPTLEGKETSFKVQGSYVAQALVKALNDVGFHVKVTK